MPKEPATTADNKRLQMADIARLAGVSVATVSRALNGSNLVGRETRERIAELARSLNDSINLSAQNLRLKKNQTVAVVVPYDARSRQHISDPFFLAMVGSLADALADRGYDMLLSRVDAEALDSAATLVDSGKAIGLVIIGQWGHHDQLNDMAARRVPVVVWGAQLPQQLYCSVGGDNQAGGLLATQHLLALGRRRIVFLGDARLPEVELRLQGYRQALQQAGIAVDAGLELPVPFEVMAARHAMDVLCAAGVGFDAVVACSDLLALQAVQAVHAVGRRGPQDVAVVGVTTWPWLLERPPTDVGAPARVHGRRGDGGRLGATAAGPACGAAHAARAPGAARQRAVAGGLIASRPRRPRIDPVCRRSLLPWPSC